MNSSTMPMTIGGSLPPHPYGPWLRMHQECPFECGTEAAQDDCSVAFEAAIRSNTRRPPAQGGRVDAVSEQQREADQARGRSEQEQRSAR